MVEIDKLHNRWRGQVNRGILEFICLILLQSKKYGYDLVTTIRDNFEIANDISDGPIYALLSRLEKRDILVSSKEKKEGRTRKYYQLTEVGDEYLQLMMQDWSNLKQSIDQINY